MALIDTVATLKDSIAQLMGATYMENLGDLSATDNYKLVDIGKDVEEMEGGVDKFVKAMAIRIGKLVIDARKYKGEFIQIFRDTMEFGGITESIKFGIADIFTDDTFNLVNGTSYAEKEHTFYQPKVKAKLFEEMKAFLIPISYSEDSVMMAFRDWEEMGKFMGLIYITVENALELAMQALTHAMAQCGIAISDKATETALHLLTEYKQINPDFEKTGMTALRDVEYQKFILERIATLKDNMRLYTANFNNGSYQTFTNTENLNQAYLANFVNAVQYNLNLGIYKDAGIEGEYDKISAWQGVALTITDDDSNTTEETFEYANNSKIMLKADTSNKLGIGKSAYTKGDCIGLIYDKKAIWMNIFKQRVNSSYTANASFWTNFTHVLYNLCIDSDFNIVALFND